MASPTGSLDEGEIHEGPGNELKATTLPVLNGNGVDRRDRTQGRDSYSPDRDHSRVNTHSSHNTNSPRGSKRARDDRESTYNNGRGGGDSRHLRAHHERASRDRPFDTSHQGRRPYEDLDRPSSRGSAHRQANWGYRDQGHDRDRHADKRPRTRSRSPQRSYRNSRDRHDRPAGRAERRPHETNQYSAHSARQALDDASKKTSIADAAADSKVLTQTANGVVTKSSTQQKALPTSGASTQYNPNGTDEATDWKPEETIDEDAEIERRRKRREEILKKARASTPMIQAALQAGLDAGPSPQVSTPMDTGANTPRSVNASAPMSPADVPEALSLNGLDLARDQDLMNMHTKEHASHDDDGPSAAGYDPTMDMQEDERRDELRNGHVGLHGQERRPSASVALAEDAEGPVKESDPAAEAAPADADDDDFDMFADDFDEGKYVAPVSKVSAVQESKAVQSPAVKPAAGGILEGDDKDGYYKIRLGEILGGRYQVQAALGKGMFSGVVRAIDITTKTLVAVKIMRNNDALKKGGYTEIAILQKLNAADAEGKKNIVRFERSFEHKGHLCMVFENLSMNLREVLKKFGNNVGISMKGVRVYAYQIFVALAHMRKCSIVHADLKPDNILVNDGQTGLRICDLGTAIDRSDAATAQSAVTPYLVSRFYRAPEIILGIPYDYGADMWSIGCTLYEMYTGKILFTGDSNNQMLKSMMEIRGKLSSKLYRRGDLWRLHFDEVGNFISQERDKILGKTAVRTLPNVKITRDLRTRLVAASVGMTDGEAKELNLFHDLLDRCLALNPDKRITPHDALRHPFFASRLQTGSKK